MLSFKTGIFKVQIHFIVQKIDLFPCFGNLRYAKKLML